MRHGNLRDHGSSILVAALSSAFGVLLLQVIGALTTMVRAHDIAESETLQVVLSIVAFVFLAIAVFVGAIVTTNSFSTIIAGRTRTIALLRLLGSSASAQRRVVAGEGLVVGVIGSLIGAAAGTLIAMGSVRIAIASSLMPDLDYAWLEPVLILPILIVTLTTWLSSWIGSRRVLRVTPLEALGAAVESDERAGRRGRNATALTLVIVGFALLVLAILSGLVTPLGVLVGLVGGMVSFTGIILGADRVMPPVLRLLGRMLGRAPVAQLAAANAVRYPERSARTTIGLVIGVTLVVMFAVAMQSYVDLVTRSVELHGAADGWDDLLAVTVLVFSALIGFSALIAAVGIVNTLSLSVHQRRRELGLLRALGFTRGQVRLMIAAEAAQYAAAAVLVGTALGVFYGWVGAQSLLGSTAGQAIVPPAIPWLVPVSVALAAAVITLAASVGPARSALRVSPVAALATD